VVSTTASRTAETLAARFGPGAVQALGEGRPVVLPDGAGRAEATAATDADSGRIRAVGTVGGTGSGRDRSARHEREPDGLLVLVGDADAWQRQYALWQRVVRTGEVVVLAEAARDLRTLVGVRELPPYAAPHAGRAWTIDRDGRPSLVILPAPQGDLSRATRPAE
jgi:S-DNA-T family DNA segregation ATPase FtsK/SpoIIIE